MPTLAPGGGGVPDLLYVRDEKASGALGGSTAALTQNVRVLNTVVINTISGASLASNQVSLPAGTYRVRAAAPVYRVNRHRLRLRDVTNNVTLALGVAAYTNSTTPTSQGLATLSGHFTLAATATVELQHYTDSAQATDGLGVSATSGENEIYAELWIEQE